MFQAPDSGIRVMLRRDDDNKSISPTWARLVYRTPDDKPYDVAVLRVNPKEVDPSLRAIDIQGVSAHRGKSKNLIYYEMTDYLEEEIISSSMSSIIHSTR